MLRLKPQTLSLQAEDLLLLDEARKKHAEARAAAQTASQKALPSTEKELKSAKLKDVASRIGLPMRTQ
jgi:hypothetical protein